MIESYDFGHIVIDKREYTSDVIIYPYGVDGTWRRKEGHRLDPADLPRVIREKPEVLVVGTGYYGGMRVPVETRKHLESQGIRVIVERTTEAWQTYNRLCHDKKTIAALHLTC